MIHLRLATIRDLPMMFKWRNQVEVFRGFYNQTKPLTWREHTDWWGNRENQLWFIILYNRSPVGAVYATHLDTHCPEIGYYIGRMSLWGQGIATGAVRLILERLKKGGYVRFSATTSKENKASIRVLEKLGFQHMGLSSRPTHLYYEKKPLPRR